MVVHDKTRLIGWLLVKNILFNGVFFILHVALRTISHFLRKLRSSIESHTNITKYPHQRIIVIAIRNYAYTVPYVKKDDETYFLKTIIPDRKFTRHYIRGEK